jgi:hypothetical protein
MHFLLYFCHLVSTVCCLAVLVTLLSTCTAFYTAASHCLLNKQQANCCCCLLHLLQIVLHLSTCQDLELLVGPNDANLQQAAAETCSKNMRQMVNEALQRLLGFLRLPIGPNDANLQQAAACMQQKHAKTHSHRQQKHVTTICTCSRSTKRQCKEAASLYLPGCRARPISMLLPDTFPQSPPGA